MTDRINAYPINRVLASPKVWYVRQGASTARYTSLFEVIEVAPLPPMIPLVEIDPVEYRWPGVVRELSVFAVDRESGALMAASVPSPITGKHTHFALAFLDVDLFTTEADLYAHLKTLYGDLYGTKYDEKFDTLIKIVGPIHD